MKLVTAVVRPCYLEDVRTAAARIGLDGLMVTEAISDLARSGRDVDSRVLVCALAETIRIRTRQTGRRARAWLVPPAWTALLLIWVWMPLAALAAPKTDVIVLVNGDRLTGEIKSLEHNRLKLSTYHMGTVHIEWDKVARVQSDQFLLLEREEGVRYYGQLKPSTEDGRLQVDRGDARATPKNVAMASVVRAAPIEGGEFIDRLDGYVSAGLDIAKANDRRSMDFAGGLSSRTRVREWALDGSMNLTDDDSGETSERHETQFQYRQFRERRDFYLGFGGFSRNTELDLKLPERLQPRARPRPVREEMPGQGSSGPVERGVGSRRST